MCLQSTSSIPPVGECEPQIGSLGVDPRHGPAGSWRKHVSVARPRAGDAFGRAGFADRHRSPRAPRSVALAISRPCGTGRATARRHRRRAGGATGSPTPSRPTAIHAVARGRPVWRSGRLSCEIRDGLLKRGRKSLAFGGLRLRAKKRPYFEAYPAVCT